MNILFWIMGVILIASLIYTLKDANTSGEVLRRLIVFYSIVIFILMLILLVLLLVNGLGFAQEGKMQVGVASIILMTVCAFLFKRNKI